MKDTLQAPPKVKVRVLPTMSLKNFRLKVLKTLKLPVSTHIQLWIALERGPIVDFAELEMTISDRQLEWWGVEDNSKIVYRAD